MWQRIALRRKWGQDGPPRDGETKYCSNSTTNQPGSLDAEREEMNVVEGEPEGTVSSTMGSGTAGKGAGSGNAKQSTPWPGTGDGGEGHHVLPSFLE